MSLASRKQSSSSSSGSDDGNATTLGESYRRRHNDGDPTARSHSVSSMATNVDGESSAGNRGGRDIALTLASQFKQRWTKIQKTANRDATRQASSSKQPKKRPVTTTAAGRNIDADDGELTKNMAASSSLRVPANYHGQLGVSSKSFDGTDDADDQANAALRRFITFSSGKPGLRRSGGGGTPLDGGGVPKKKRSLAVRSEELQQSALKTDATDEEQPTTKSRRWADSDEAEDEGGSSHSSARGTVMGWEPRAPWMRNRNETDQLSSDGTEDGDTKVAPSIRDETAEVEESAACSYNALTSIYACEHPPEKLPHGYEPTEHDVLFGRGKSCWKHCGNSRFRSIVERMLPSYLKTDRLGKARIVRKVIDEIRGIGNGRFLKQVGISPKQWHEVGDAAARGKVSHAFRDAHAAERNKHERETKRKQKIAVFGAGSSPEMRKGSIDTRTETIAEAPSEPATTQVVEAPRGSFVQMQVHRESFAQAPPADNNNGGEGSKALLAQILEAVRQADVQRSLINSDSTEGAALKQKAQNNAWFRLMQAQQSRNAELGRAAHGNSYQGQPGHQQHRASVNQHAHTQEVTTQHNTHSTQNQDSRISELEDGNVMSQLEDTKNKIKNTQELLWLMQLHRQENNVRGGHSQTQQAVLNSRNTEGQQRDMVVHFPRPTARETLRSHASETDESGVTSKLPFDHNEAQSGGYAKRAAQHDPPRKKQRVVTSEMLIKVERIKLKVAALKQRMASELGIH